MGSRDESASVDDRALPVPVRQTATLTEPIEVSKTQWAVVLSPPKQTDEPTLEAAEALFRTLHGEVERVSFEIEQRPDEEIVIRLVCGSYDVATRVQQLVVSAYPHAEAHIEETPPLLEADAAVALGRVEIEQDYLLPIKNTNSADPHTVDPYRPLIDTIDAADGRALIQTVVEPVEAMPVRRLARGLPYRREDPRWWRLPAGRHSRWDSLGDTIGCTLLVAAGWWLLTQFFAIASLGVTVLFAGLGVLLCGMWWASLFGHHHIPTRMTTGEIAEALRKKTWSRAKATRSERRTAEQIAERAQADAFRVSMRVLTIDDTPAGAREHQRRLAQQLRAGYHDSITGQRLHLKPIRGARRLDRGLARLLARRHTATRARKTWSRLTCAAQRQDPMVMTASEVGALCHAPDRSDVQTNKIDWSKAHVGAGVPIGMPRFDFEQYGLEEGSRAEKQLAMFEHSDEDAPLYYGWGTKMGTEAGLFEHNLDAHQFVGGATRVGKTNFLINFCSNAFIRRKLSPAASRRWLGGLIIDPKGADADEFIREWPEDRPDEDLIVMDLGTDPDGNDWENVPRFNPLEVPAHHADADIEKIAENMTAMVSEAGADDKYLGSVMKRVTKTVARGMARSDEQATIMDLACAASEPEHLETFAQWMEDEQIDFIRDTARRLADANLELDPLAGRFDEWLHNPSIRNLITARNPSFSIQDAIDSGKVIVVRFGKNASDSEKRLVSLPLLARAEAAKKISENDDPFYVVVDEFDDVATEQTNLHKTLSKAGAHHFRLTMACQAPVNQLPKTLKNALENQCETFITFNPRGKQDAKFVAQKHTVSAEDISNISKYQMYMRSHDADDNFTESYLVNAFPPIREIRETVTGAPGMTDAALLALKRRSMARYGKPMKTAAEQQRDSKFYPDPGVGGAGGGTSVTSECNQTDLALKAIEDSAIRAGSPGGFVAISACLDKLRAYCGEDFRDVDTVWRTVLQDIPETQLAYRERNGREEVRVLDRSWLDVGTSASSGGREHALLLTDAYQPLTQLGFVVEVVDQSTGAATDTLPDGIVWPTDAIDVEGLDPAEDAGEIADRVNQFRESTENRAIARLIDVREGYLEAEHSTTLTQPSQAIANAIGAANDGRRCLYLVRPDHASKLHGYLSQEPAGARSNHDVAGEIRYYTKSQTLRIDETKMTRPGDPENVWVKDEASGQFILRDGEGTEHARFDSVRDIFSNASQYAGGECNVRAPFIPEYELDSGDMSAVDYDIITIPHPEVDDEGERRRLTPLDCALYHPDGNIPLMDLDRSGEPEREPSSTTADDLAAIHEAIDTAASAFSDEPEETAD